MPKGSDGRTSDCGSNAARSRFCGAEHDCPIRKGGQARSPVVKDDGTSEIGAQLLFFESGLTNVVPVKAGQIPSGASLSLLANPVVQVASANHCSMH